MTVYIEQVIFDNLIINYILLWMSGQMVLKNTKFLRLFLADLLGTVFSAIFPYLALSGILLLIVKIALGLLMVLIAFKTNSVKKFFVVFLCFVFFTGLAGGLSFALILSLYPQAMVADGSLVYQGLPMGIIYLIVFVIARLVLDFCKATKKKSNIQANSCKLKIICQNTTHSIRAYIDTGNLLSYEDKPVIVVSFAFFKKLFKLSTEDFLKGNYNVPNSFYIKTHSPNGSASMLAFCVDKIVLLADTERQIDCILALSVSDIENKFGCQALIGKFVLECK